jgi:hypothetical protein
MSPYALLHSYPLTLFEVTELQCASKHGNVCATDLFYAVNYGCVFQVTYQQAADKSPHPNSRMYFDKHCTQQIAASATLNSKLCYDWRCINNYGDLLENTVELVPKSYICFTAQ